MKIDKISLPLSDIAQIAAIEDATVRQALYGLLGRAESDPESIRLEDYEGEAPVVQSFARRLVKRVDDSHRRAEAYKARKKAAAERAAREAAEKAEREAAEKAAAEKAEKEAREAAAKAAAKVAAEEGFAPLSSDGSRANVITMPNYRKFLWFRQNFSLFVDNVISVIRSIQTEDMVFGALCEGFDEICGVISLVLNPMAARVGEVMQMPRLSRPGRLEFVPAAPITKDDLLKSSRIGFAPRPFHHAG